MDEIIRGELEKLHGRISDLKERVVTLEAQQPHINAALLRIEGAVTAGFARIGKIALAVSLAFLTPLALLVVKFATSGALSKLM
jgi:hypothetical protein